MSSNDEMRIWLEPGSDRSTAVVGLVMLSIVAVMLAFALGLKAFIAFAFICCSVLGCCWVYDRFRLPGGDYLPIRDGVLRVIGKHSINMPYQKTEQVFPAAEVKGSKVRRHASYGLGDSLQVFAETSQGSSLIWEHQAAPSEAEFLALAEELGKLDLPVRLEKASLSDAGEVVEPVLLPVKQRSNRAAWWLVASETAIVAPALLLPSRRWLAVWAIVVFTFRLLVLTMTAKEWKWMYIYAGLRATVWYTMLAMMFHAVRRRMVP